MTSQVRVGRITSSPSRSAADHCTGPASPDEPTGASVSSNTDVEPDGTCDSSDWKTEIARSIEMLDRIMQTSEEGFLSVGAQLRTIHLGAKNISEQLVGLLNDYSGERDTDSLAELYGTSERSVTQLSSFNEFSIKTVDQLQTFKSPLVSLPESLKKFDRLVSRLRIMGITARIESARVGEGGLGFVHLAEEVSGLGEQISVKAKEVHRYVNEVGGVIEINQSKLESLIHEHKVISERIKNDLELNLKILDEKREMSRQTTRGISSKSEDALRNVHTVVESVQYHDITRQQVDHVVEALRTIGEHDSELEVVPICQIQAAHLKRAGEEFDDAILSVVAALSELSNAVKTMLSESEQMSDFTENSGNTFFNYVERGLEVVSATLTEDQTAISGLAESLQDISENVCKMKSFMDQMAEVGSEIELLALNSRVRAAKTGTNRAALGVIAESIQRLSMDAHA